jgi:hypothetical protein
LNESPYVVEHRLADTWVFFSARSTYADARASADRLLAALGGTRYRIRRNNELIDTNDYDYQRYHRPDELLEWRRRHIG